MPYSSLGKSAGEFSTGVGIKPSNLLSQNGPVEAQPDLLHLPFTGSLEERDLKVGSNEHGGRYAKEVEHLNVDNTDKFTVCEAASLVLDTVRDKIIHGRGGCDDIRTVKSGGHISSNEKLCDGKIVGDRRKRERTVDGSIGEIVGKLLGDVSVDESIGEVTEDEHEQGKGHAMTDGQD